MAKVTALQGKAVGKVGSMVYSNNSGQMIAREYNPNVANPNTTAQTNQRAKLKLMSQLAAALAPVIAIPKDGIRSSRNQFVSKNFPAVIAHEGVAVVTYENLQLTNGSAGLPAIKATRDANSGITVSLLQAADAAVTRVVYIMYRKTNEANLQFVDSVIVENAGSNGNFPATLPYDEGDVVLFAYGLKDLSAKATAKYNSYEVESGMDLARLALNRSLKTSDYQFTVTRGTTLFKGETETLELGPNEARIFLTAIGYGSVNGPKKGTIGEPYTVTATQTGPATFLGWKLNGSNEIFSTNETLTFTLQRTMDLVAVFGVADTSGVLDLTIRKGENVRSASGPNMAVEAGFSVSLYAEAAEGYEIAGWYDVTDGNATLLHSGPTYNFIPVRDMIIEVRAREETPIVNP